MNAYVIFAIVGVPVIAIALAHCGVLLARRSSDNLHRELHEEAERRAAAG